MGNLQGARKVGEIPGRRLTVIDRAALRADHARGVETKAPWPPKVGKGKSKNEGPGMTMPRKFSTLWIKYTYAEDRKGQMNGKKVRQRGTKR